MKKITKIPQYLVLIIIISIISILIWERACNEGPSDSDIERIERSFSEYKEKVKAEEQEWQKERAELQEKVTRWMTEAGEWKAESQKYRESVATRDKEIDELKGVYPTLQDKDEKIANLLKQNILLESSLDEAKMGWAAEEQRALRLEAVIETKDRVIAGLERQLENKDALLKLSEELVATQKQKIKSLKLGKTLSQVLAVGGCSVALWQTLID